jgi:hypothetical protein
MNDSTYHKNRYESMWRIFYYPGTRVPFYDSDLFSPHVSLAFLCSAASSDRGIRTPTSVTCASVQPALAQPLDQS